MAMGVASYVSYEALRAPKDGMSPLITMGYVSPSLHISPRPPTMGGKADLFARMGLSGVIATSFPKMLIAVESAPAPPAGAVPQ